MMLKKFLCAALLLSPVSTQAQGALSEPQKEAVREVVKEYLLKNPEIVQEAIGELERRQAAAQEAAQKLALNESRQTIFQSPSSVVVGNPAGDVTLVEFFDYNCGFCKKSLTDMQGLIKSDARLRVILKDFPVLGPDSVEASRVALAAKRQLKGDQVWEFHSRVMSLRGRVTGERTLQVAKEMGLDTAKIQTDMNSEAVKKQIEENVKLGDRLNLSGTPAFIIGNDIVFGAVGEEALRKAVLNTRQCGRTAC